MAEADDSASSELPTDVIEEVERLTRLARRADGEEASAYRTRRDELLADDGFEARVREDGDGPVLVCYPAEWLDDGEVVFERIDDRSRAIERPLTTSGDDWETVERDNREVVACVGREYGAVHEANVRAFADFLGNHHLCRITRATEAHVTEFLDEYYPRNAWPSDEQRAVIEQSLRYAFKKADVDRPPID